MPQLQQVVTYAACVTSLALTDAVAHTGVQDSVPQIPPTYQDFGYAARTPLRVERRGPARSAESDDRSPRSRDRSPRRRSRTRSEDLTEETRARSRRRRSRTRSRSPRSRSPVTPVPAAAAPAPQGRGAHKYLLGAAGGAAALYAGQKLMGKQGGLSLPGMPGAGAPLPPPPPPPPPASPCMIL